MSRKYTYEQVKYFVEVKSESGCKLISKKYINSITKMKFLCRCGTIFETTLSSFRYKNKHKCNNCAYMERPKGNLLTYDNINKYIQQFNCHLITTQKEFEDIRKHTHQTTNKTKLQILCSCGNEFICTFNNFKNKNKHQCNECGKKNRLKKQTKTHDEFINEVKHLVGLEYSILSRYNNSRSLVKVKHNICGHEWMVSPKHFLHGTRCPKCFGNQRKTTEQFKQELYELVGDEYTVLGEYVNANTKIKVRHNICRHVWGIKPNNFLHGDRCPKCANNIKNTTQDFQIKVQEAVGNEYTVLGEYINTHAKIKMRHNCHKCNNHEYNVTPANFLNGSRCPMCNESKGERKIRDILLHNDISFDTEYSFSDLKGEYDLLRFDFAIFKDKEKTELKCLIEYDGELHYRNSIDECYLKRQQNYDNRKNEYCKNNNIQLIRIPYWEFDNIEGILLKKLNPNNKINDINNLKNIS